MMRWMLILALCLCCAPLFAGQDVATWQLQGRVDNIEYIAFPGLISGETLVTVNTLPPQLHGGQTQVVLRCDPSSGIDCSVAILGSCSKHSTTTTSGGYVFVVWTCDNKHAADCRYFSGYMADGLVGDSGTSGPSCLY